jgi:phage/plasmid-like protein (TIGR03299 family)
MSHNIYNDGQKDCMFVVGKVEDAWHRLGQRCDKAISSAEAMQLAGLDWTVSKQQNYARNMLGHVVATDSYTVFRSSDNAQLGTVGAGYAVRQNWQHFEFVDALLEANGGSHYDSAGALGNGSRIWLSVRVPKADFAVGDDKHETYLVFASSHDATLAHTAKLSSVRVVCQNTLTAALNDGEKMFRVKHTKQANARLDTAKLLMSGVVANAQNLQAKLDRLANRKMTRESMVSILNRLFPVPKEENANTTRRENVISEVLNLYAANDNDAFPEQRGTAYAMLNAVTNYTDHLRTARITKDRSGMDITTARAENAVMGTGDVLKSAALAVIDEVTTEAPSVASSFEPRGGALAANPMTDSEFLKSIGIRL